MRQGKGVEFTQIAIYLEKLSDLQNVCFKVKISELSTTIC